MKKRIAVLLSVVLALTVLTGCGGDGKVAEGEIGICGLKRNVWASSLPLGCTFMKHNSTIRSEAMLKPVDSMSKNNNGRESFNAIGMGL